ncbi:unnamed protein product [Lactuca virosa]|uniref:Uncharacterized protein n=1 Tax=Lactuca virosa TaxID=75947 RepID=A0AAU9PDB2_9ASTR|nr:unnamed protein product [Lactuca virosa]
MASKEDGQTSKAKSSPKASHSHANRPSTETHSSLPKVEMAASNYTALLNIAEQPKEVGVIIEYLQQYPLAYALLSTSSIPQYLISEVVPTAVISPRAKSKQFDVEFDLFQTTLVLPKEEFSSILGLQDNSSQPKTFVTPTSAQLLTMFKNMGYKFEDNSEPCLSRNKKSCLPTPWHFLTFVLTRCLLDQLVDTVAVKQIFGFLCMGSSMMSMLTTCLFFGTISLTFSRPQRISSSFIILASG